MESPTAQFWFPAKRYGWGWGLPVRWQGWLVLAMYFGAIALLAIYVRARGDRSSFLIGLAICTVILVAIAAWKGEKPVRWRWGE